MRYDRGFRGYDRGWTSVGPVGGMPRYDQTFRAGRGGYDSGFRGYDRGMRGYDAGYGGNGAWTAFGRGAHPSVNQHVEMGETDFLGRPYPRAAQEDVPWGLIDQERMQARWQGYDAGYHPSGGGYAGRGPRGGRGARGYDRTVFTARGPGNGGGYAGGGYGGARGYDRVAGMRWGGSYGGDWGYDRDMRPEDFHARNLPDSDVAGVDAHRYARGRDLHYHSNWTRWF
ncbi:MAG TPA: hypothetical protein VFS20_10460 [Longimicrobium sp.]|nr:hypothetical protein [Longimicrobium sp.]